MARQSRSNVKKQVEENVTSFNIKMQMKSKNKNTQLNLSLHIQIFYVNSQKKSVDEWPEKNW